MAKLLTIALFAIIMVMAGGGVWAEPVTTTDGLIALFREVVHQQYQIPKHDVLIVWADDKLEQKLTQAGEIVQVSDQVKKNLVGKQSLLLDVLHNGKYQRKLMIQVTVDGWATVFTTNRPLVKGELFTQDNVKKARQRLSNLPKYFVQNADNLLGAEAKYPVRANQVVTQQMLKQPPIIFKGDQIKVRVVNGELILMAQGEALENAVKGQQVKVKILNFSSQKIVYARAIGSGEVEILIN